jgi:hypothetical protein
MRIKDALAPLTTVFVLLAQPPEQPTDGTTKERKEHEPQAKLEWLVELSHSFASVAGWTWHVHFAA